MKKFIFYDLPVQMFICFLIVVCWFNWPYASAAENILSFWGVFCLVVCVLVIPLLNKLISKKVDDPDYKITYWRFWIPNVIVFFQFLALTAMGWYWVAAGFAAVRVIASIEREGVMNLRKGKEVDAKTS